MKRFLGDCFKGTALYVKWLSKQTVGFLNAIFFLTVAGKMGTFLGTILLLTVCFLGSYWMVQDDYAELSILNAISSSETLIIDKNTGEVLAK